MAASTLSSRARSALSRLASTRLFSSSSSSSPSSPPRLRRPSPLPALSPFASSSSSVLYLHQQIRFRTNRPEDSSYSPLKSGSNFSDRPPTEMAPLFPGCDYEHWLIVMDKPGGEGASKKEMIDCYIRTLAKVVGSEEEAKKKIYNVSCDRFFGFGCEIDEETSSKLEGLPGVLFVLPDSYVDVEHKDYGAELFVDGEIVQRPLERMFKIEPESSLSVRSRHADIRNDRARGIVRES